MKRYTHNVDTVFTMLLFCIFAVSLLLVLMTGAKAYSGVKDTMEAQYGERTCINYVAAKVRHHDEQDGVYIGEIDGIPALCMSEIIDGEEYITYMYHYGGCVKELFAEAELDLPADAGLDVVSIMEFTLSEAADGLIYIHCMGADGGTAEMFVSSRSGGAQR